MLILISCTCLCAGLPCMLLDDSLASYAHCMCFFRGVMRLKQILYFLLLIALVIHTRPKADPPTTQRTDRNELIRTLAQIMRACSAFNIT